MKIAIIGGTGMVGAAAVAEAAGRAREARQEHTWLSRARTVAKDMEAIRAGELAPARTLRAGGIR